MRSRFALVLLIGLGTAVLPAMAAAEQPAATAGKPWEKAAAVLDATNADAAAGGFAAIRKHLGDLEAALATADDAYKAADTGTGPIYVLTDGPTDTLAQLIGAAAAHEQGQNPSGRQTVAVANPYPPISLYLGAYYNEVGENDQALRVLDKGLSFYSGHGAEFGITKASIISERAVALTRLGRMDEALTAYQDGLKVPGLENGDRARLLRGCGYVLTEKNRLDEAEQAYQESLKYEPGNRIALGELEYIAKLRAGGQKAPGGVVLPNAQPKAE